MTSARLRSQPYAMMKDQIMRQLQERILEQAHQQAHFRPQRSHFYIIKIREGQIVYKNPTEKAEVDICSSLFRDWKQAFSSAWEISQAHQRTLNCIFQCTRPPHISGRPDYLPFANKLETQAVFDTLRLPSSYFQIVSGTAGSAQAHIFRDHGRAEQLEFIAHCLSKQGDWAIALSHDAEKRVTSVFWSVDDKIDSTSLLNDFRDFQRYASHPMLIPCIMFAANLRMSEQRRHTIKDTLQSLESAIQHISQKEASSYDHDAKAYDRDEQPQSLETYFQMLHSCRKDQSSRKGRYGFWRDFVESVEKGFGYIESLMSDAPDQSLLEAHLELKRWIAINHSKLESLMARDEDHVYRVDNVSHMLYSLVEQRDLRVQSGIARATQRDSEDMKFLAVMGSIFLPASLVATILNVPEFQFAMGASLFGAYLGITLPLIAIVILLCFARPQLKRWPWLFFARSPRRSRSPKPRSNTMMSRMSD